MSRPACQAFFERKLENFCFTKQGGCIIMNMEYSAVGLFCCKYDGNVKNAINGIDVDAEM